MLAFFCSEDPYAVFDQQKCLKDVDGLERSAPLETADFDSRSD
jgi:hypothetical protein